MERIVNRSRQICEQVELDLGKILETFQDLNLIPGMVHVEHKNDREERIGIITILMIRQILHHSLTSQNLRQNTLKGVDNNVFIFQYLP